MSCPHCGGLLHDEWAPGHKEERPLRLQACFTCGDRIDPVILAHRAFCRRRNPGTWRTNVWRVIQDETARLSEKA